MSTTCRAKARAAPAVKLYYNDFGVEYSDRDSTARRNTMLRALERWRRAGKNLGVCLSPQGKPVFA